ncbi:MAG: Tetratricopeptide repeat [Holophagaceae bacterium]|nr:Tetratricopeptide repeat [Holophagaceae bacterium]
MIRTCPRLLRTCLVLVPLAFGLVPEARAQGLDASIFRRYRAVDASMDRANRAVGAGRFEEARTLLSPCLAQIPDHYEGHFLLARMAYEAKDFKGTLAHLDVAETSLASLDRIYRDQVAHLKAQAEAEEQAAKSNLEAVNSRVSDPIGCAWPLLLALRNEVDIRAARRGPLHDTENPYGVPADYHFLRGNALYRLGRRDEARAQLRLAVQTDPGHGNAWNNLIALHLEARDLAQAQACLGQAEAAKVAVRPELKQAVLQAAR